MTGGGYTREEAMRFQSFPEKLTKAERQILELATREPSGNPWPLIGIRQRSGGGKARMFEKLVARGYFDNRNCITLAGRAALAPPSTEGAK